MLSSHYSYRQIYVRSADADRCIESALANLAGIYPPVGNQVWNRNIKWQPIAVHTVSDDHLLGDNLDCPAYKKANDALMASKQFQELLMKNQPLLQYLTLNTGRKIDDILSALKLRNTLSIEDDSHLK